MAIAPLYRAYLEIARERGVDIAAALRDTGMSEQQLLDPAGRLSPEQGVTIAKALLRNLNFPAIGLEAARRFRLSDMDLFGYLLKCAPDLSSLLMSVQRYGRLIGDSAAFTVEITQAEAIVNLARSGDRQMLPEGSDFAVAALMQAIYVLSDQRALPSEVRLARIAPRDTAPYHQFFRTRIVFDAGRGALVYPRSLLGVPLLHSDPELLRILRRQADRELAALPPDSSLVARVRTYLVSGLERGDCELSSVAASLGMSERTLRRRLLDEQTSYRELFDSVRRERALILADQADHPVTTIAIMSGFADPASFARAFRRWTGRLPSDYLLERRTKSSSGDPAKQP